MAPFHFPVMLVSYGNDAVKFQVVSLLAFFALLAKQLQNRISRASRPISLTLCHNYAAFAAFFTL
jgi:hypothetical protein